ncbi:MAG: TnpV protein [Defluviitaleaceae bacterium]|nr:TnpV protein [Defluviitaleaceae bacterium]
MGNENIPVPLSRWGRARLDYLKEYQPLVAAQFGAVGLHKHCAEIEEQAEERKHNMMTAIRKDPANRVTERDKSADPMAWVGRMNNYQASVHEVIYAELIYA